MNRPRTRSFYRKRARSPTPSEPGSPSGSPTISEERGTPTSPQDIQEHLKQVQDGVQIMAHEMETLRQKNGSIQDKLTSMKQSLTKTRTKRPRIEDDSESDNLRTHELENIIKDLKVQNKRQKKRIEELEASQVQEELQDLRKSSEEPSDGAEMDPPTRMRKLLRNFSDLMITNTISSDMSETCPICFETLRVKKCSSLECQHILCDVCLQSIVKADETLKCPECRRTSTRDSTKTITMTEQDRWDKLLNVAQAWDAFDHRGDLETSEEEDEENFITEGSGISEASGENDQTSSEDPTNHSTAAEEESRASTPPSMSNTPFFSSPTREKRKRLEQLAEERANKKQK